MSDKRMTLDNCIKMYKIWASDDRISPDIREEHKQMVEWLTDYKKMLGQKPCGDVVDRQSEDADTLPSIYIIGSLSQAKQIKKVNDSIKDADVRYVQSEPDKTFNECVSTCFDNIEWADSIYVVLKPDGTIGQGVTYELEYAKRLNKEIQYISKEEDKE